MDENKIKLFIDKLLKDKSLEEQVVILRNCLEDHALTHPWADSELVDSIIENISNEYDIPYDETDTG